jgi:hypothetical protein
MGQIYNWRLPNGIPAIVCGIFLGGQVHPCKKAILMPSFRYYVRLRWKPGAPDIALDATLTKTSQFLASILPAEYDEIMVAVKNPGKPGRNGLEKS